MPPHCHSEHRSIRPFLSVALPGRQSKTSRWCTSAPNASAYDANPANVDANAPQVHDRANGSAASNGQDLHARDYDDYHHDCECVHVKALHARVHVDVGLGKED